MLRHKLAALAVASCFAAGAQANPTGATVVSGNASFQASGNTLNITNSPGAIINWQAFSIRPDEITRFIQQGAASAVLNRVTGSEISSLMGQLLSNGKVFLINPNGVFIGRGAVIDTAGFVASSLRLSDADFLAGKFKFDEQIGAGRIVNQGTIKANGGPVYLVAPNVENHGVITSPTGEVILAAGKTVELVNAGSPHVRVELTAPDNEVLNVGQVVANSGRVGIFGTAIRNSGTVSASAASVDAATGKVVFRAKKDITLEAGSRIEASGVQGGTVTVQAEQGTLLVDGFIEAINSLPPTAAGPSATGGSIQLLGQRVGLIGNAQVDASGQAGGGTVLVGGDLQGKNPDVQNADAVFVGQGAAIRANAGASGDGGKVILWSESVTRVHGSVSARGGDASGNGGLVETSSRNQLDVTGMQLDLKAPKGRGGEWLIDPYNVTISGSATNGAITVNGGNQFAPNATGGNILAADINTQLNSDVSVTITTAAGAGVGTEAGNITQNAGATISKTAGTGSPTLTMNAAGDITLNAGITASSGTLNVNLLANDQAAAQNDQATTSGAITLAAGVTTRGGTFTANAFGFDSSGQTIDTRGVAGATGTAGGDVSITSTGNVSSGSILTSGGDSSGGNNNAPASGTVSVLGSGGTTTLGAIDTHGAAASGNGAAGAAGGAVTVTRSGGSVSLGAITTTGGNATGGSGGGRNGGDAGAITVRSSNNTVTLGGGVTASAGTGASANGVDGTVTFGTATGANSVGAVSGALNAITAGTVTVFSDGGTVDLSNASNNIAKLGAITASGTVNVTNNAALQVDGAINAAGQNVSINTGSNATSFTANATAVFIGSGTLTVTAADVDGINNIGALTGPNVILQPNATAATIGLNVADSASFTLTAADIAKLKLGGTNLTVGASGGTGAVTLGGDVDFAGGAKTLTLRAGQVNDATNSFIAETLNLTLASAGGANVAKSTATTVNVNTSGATGAANQGIMLTEADGATVTFNTGAGGAATVTSTTGNLTIGASTVGGAFTGTSTAGSIGNSGNLSAASVNATANTSIDLATTTSSITFSSGTTTSIANTGAATVGGTGVGVTVSTSGNMTVNAISGGATGIQLDATGTITGSGLLTGDTIKLGTLGNTTSLGTTGTPLSVRNVAGTASPTVQAAASTGGVFLSQTVGDLATSSYKITTAAGAQGVELTAQAGKITYDGLGASSSASDDDWKLTTVASSKDIAFSGSNTLTGNSATLTATGAITHGGNTNDIDVSAGTGNVVLSGTSVGATGQAIGVKTNGTGNAQATASTGDVYLTSDAALRVVAITTATGTQVVDVRTTGTGKDITFVASNVTGGGTADNVTIVSSGAIAQTAGTLTGGDVVLDSQSGAGTSGARLAVNATNLAARAAASGGVFVTDPDAVSIKTLGGMTNTVTAGNTYDVRTTAGSITVTNDIAATGSGGVTLIAGGTGSDILAGGGRISTGSGSVVLDAQGGIGVGAGSPLLTNLGTGTIKWTTAGANAAGDVAISNNTAGGLATSQIVNTSATAGTTQLITLVQTAGDVTVDGSIVVGTDNLTIKAGAGNIVGGAGTLTANNIRLDAVNAIGATTPAPVKVTPGGAVSAQLTAGTPSGDVVIEASGAATIGTADGLNGISSNGGKVDFKSGGTLTLAQNVNAGTGDVRLTSGAGITQTGGAITANLLGARAAGAVSLSSATNNASTVAIATSAAGVIAYRDADGFTVGTVGTLGNFTSTTGVVSNGAVGDDVLLQSGAATMTLSQNVNAGSGDVRLASGAGISQTDGAITANLLGMTAGGAIDVTVSTNNAATLAATTSAGTIAYRDTDALTIGSVGAQTVSNATFAATNGLVTTGTGSDILVQTGGAQTLTQALTAANSGNVRLASGAGISQTGGAITANLLGMTAAGVIDVTTATNDAATLGATTSAGTINYRDANALTVGTVGAQTLGTASFASTSGLVTTGTGTDILVQTGGAQTLAQNVSANAGANDVRLASGAGISQTGGSVTANLLGMTAGGAIDVTVSTNNAATLAATTSAGTIAYRDTDALTVGTVATQTVSNATFAATTGLSTTGTGTDILVQTGGAQTLTQNVNANAGANDVRLVSGANISQTGGAITAANLGATAATGIALAQAGNDATTVALGTSGTGTISYRDTNGFTVGQVAAQTLGNASFALTTGVVTKGGAGLAGDDILLQGGAATMTLAQAVNAGAGDVRLLSGSNINQTGGTITANLLGVRAAGAVDLNSTTNNVATLGVATSAAGAVRYQDTNGFNLGTVGTSGNFTSVSGATVNSGALTLQAGGAVGQASVSDNISSNGLELLGTSVDYTLTNAGNAIATLAANAGAVRVRDDNGFTVGQVNTTGITTAANGVVTLTSAGTLQINNDISSGGAVTQNGGGAVTVGGTGTRGITTSADNVSFAGNVTLNEALSIINGGSGTPSNGDISFNGTLTGGQNLTLTAGGSDILFNGQVGATALGAMLVNSARNVTANSSVAATSLVQSAGSGLTWLKGTVTTTGAAGLDLTGTNMTLDGTVTATTGSGIAKFNNSGTLAINADISSGGALTQSGGGTVTVGGTGTRTLTTSTANVSFANPLSLANALSVQTSGNGTNGNVSFSGALTSAAGRNLTINAGTSDVTFGASAAVGSVANPLGVVQVTSRDINVNGGMNTAAAGTVTLTNSGTLNLNSNVSAGGAVTQNGTGGVTVGGASTITTTQDNVSFARAIQLNSALAVNTAGTGAGTGDITFSQAIDGGQNLTLTAGTSNIQFAQAVGGTTRLGTVQVNSANNVNVNNAMAVTGFNQVAGSGTTTTSTGLLSATTGGVQITAANIAVGTGGITTTAGSGGTVSMTDTGTLTVGGAINTDGNVSVSGAGTTTLNANITTSSDQVQFSQAVVLGGNRTIDTTATGTGSGGNIRFQNTLNGGTNTLNLVAPTATGDILFNGASTNLGAVTVQSAHDVAVSGTGSIAAASFTQQAGGGATTFSGAVNTTAAAGVNVTTSGTITATGGISSSSNLILLNGSNWNFSGGTINAGTSTITVSHSSNGTINIGSMLDSTDFGVLQSSNQLFIGGTSNTGVVNIDGATSFAAATPNVTLRATGSGGSITQTNQAVTTTTPATLLTLSAHSGIGTTGSPIRLSGGNVAANNTNANDIALKFTSGNANLASQFTNSASGGKMQVVADSGNITNSVQLSSAGAMSLTASNGTITVGSTGYQASGDLTLASAGDLTVGSGYGARTSGGVATLMAGNTSGLATFAGNLGVGATPASGGGTNSQMLINGPIHAGSGSFYNFNLLSTGQVLQASTGAAGIQTTHTSGTVTTKGGLQVVTFRDAGSPVTLQNAVATGTAICGTSTGGVGSGNCVGPLQIETRLANGTTATFAAGDIKYNSINGTNIFGVGTAADVVFVGPSQTVSNGSINGRNVFFYAEGSDKNAADGTGKITLNVLIKNGDINNGQSGGSLNLIADGSIVLDGSATTENALIGQRTTSNNGNTVTITYFDHNLKLVATKDIEVKGSIYLVGDLSLRANAGQSEVQALASNPASSKGTLGGNVNITRPNDYQFPVELRATNITIGDATGAFGVNNVNLTSGNMSFTGNGTRSGDVLLIATGAFNANFAGDFNLTGGTATAASGGSGTTAKVTSISGVQAANMFIRGVGTSPRQLANLNVKGGSATSTANGGGALATADAILLSTGTKTIIVDGDMNIIGGSTFAGSQGVKPANAGQASAAAIVDPIRLTITTGGDLTLESGKVGTNNQANLQSSGEIVLNVRNLFLKGAPGSGLFTGSGQALSGPPYNLPIEVNLKGGQVVITQSSIYGSVATVKSDVTPVYDGLLNYIIYAANEETRAARIRAGLGAGDDSNLPSCQ